MAANGIYNDVALKSSGVPAGGASVYVGPSTAVGTPLSPLSSIYSDAGLSAALSNPMTADANGNFFFYAAPGVYKIQVSYGGGTYTYLAEVSQSQDSMSADGITTSSITSGSGTLLMLSDTDCNAKNLTNVTNIGCSALTASGAVAGSSAVLTALGNTTSTWTFGSASELITLSTSGTTTDSSANLLPANSIIEVVTARIVTTITTATNWSVGDATIAGRFIGANGNLTAGYTIPGMVHIDQIGTSGPRQTSAAKIRITTTGTPGAGKIRIGVFYRQFTA